MRWRFARACGRALAAVLLGAAASACSSPAAPLVVQLERLAAGFSDSVYLTHAADGSGRLFVVEQAGRIRIVKGGAVAANPFLDIVWRVASGGEMGLLSVAFHPDYRNNGRFFVNYTAAQPLRTVIAEYRVSATNPDLADPASERIVLQIEQPYTNHNGGLNKFGPDGYLYVGTGDGGSGGDPHGHGQRLDTLLGKVLRLDVDGAAPYTIPPDNPFVGRGRGEIWAYGLRNPWRFSFDRADGRLFLGDVGQGSREEVNLVERGNNYGWNVMEGSLCFNPPTGCDTSGLRLPIAEYATHTDGTCAVTGGYVYRGTRYPVLRGIYFFGDYCGGQVWSLAQDGVGRWTMKEVLRQGVRISSFGEDEAGEVYAIDHGGAVYRLVARQAGGGW